MYGFIRRAIGVTVSSVVLIGCTGTPDDSATFSTAGLRPPGAEPSRIVLSPTQQPRTSQAFAWRTAAAVRAGAVEVRRAGGGATRVVDSHHSDTVTFDGWSYTARHHEAVVRGLRPDTRYRYRVGTDGGWSTWSTFRTAHGSAESWSFAYFGDAQRGLSSVWARVVERALRDRRGVDLMVHTGDLVDEPTDDGQWGALMRALQPYRRTVNTITAVGNHELRGDPGVSQFRGHFRLPRNGPPERDETTYSVDYQGVRFIVLDTNHLSGRAQRRFLRRELTGAGDRWTVVLFHQPMFAATPDRDTDPQRRAWLSTLETYGADLVLQGHDHVYARGYVPGQSPNAAGRERSPMYVISVAGGKYYELEEVDANDFAQHGARRVEAAGHTSTYQIVHVTRDVLRYRSIVAEADAESAYDVGDTLDSFRVRRR